MTDVSIQDTGDESSKRILDDIKRRQKRQQSFPDLDNTDQEILARIKHKRGGLSDEEFNEVFAGETIAPPQKRDLGPPIDKSKGLRVRQPNSDMFRTRATMSLLGDNFEEQQAAFKGLHPGGQLLRVPVTGNILYKTKPDEPFRKMDPSFSEAMGAAGFAGFLDEFENEIADLAGDGLIIAAESASLAFLRKKGGGQFISDLIRLGIGGATGETARQIIQSQKGTQRQDPNRQRALITGTGSLSIIGGTLGAGLGAVVGGLSRKGIVSTTPEGRAAVRASEDIGTMPLMTSQVSQNPFLRLLSRQSQALVPKIGKYLAEQEAKTANALRQAVSKVDLKKFVGETARAFNQASNDLVELTIQATGVRRRSPTAGGRFLQKGVERWWKVSGNDVDQLYNAARRIQEPVYDGTSLIAEAKDIGQGVLARRAIKEGEGDPFIIFNMREKSGIKGIVFTEQEAIDFINKRGDAKNLDYLQQSEFPDAAVDDASFAQMIDEVNQIGSIRIDDELSPEVRRLLTDIEQLDPNITGINTTSTEVLRSLRRRINEFTVAGPEGSRLSNSIAVRLKGAIDDTLDNPVNIDSIPGFREAWKTANAAARKRFQTREALAVIDLMKSETPAQVVSALARPGQVDNLVAVRKAVPKEEWAKFEESVITELMLDPANLSRRLAEFDQPTLNVLMNKPRQQIMKEAGQELENLFSVGVQAGLKNQTQIRGFFRDVIDTGNTAQITQFLNVVERQGGKNGPLGRATRSAVINEIWQRSRVVEQQIAKVDANKIAKTLSDFEDRGILDFLSDDDIALLRNVELVQDFARLGAKDAGTALQAASAVSDVRGGGVKGLTTLVENWTMGRLLTMPGVNKFLLGSGKTRPLDTAFIKLLTAANLQIASDVEQVAELGEEVESLVQSGARAVLERF